MKPMSLEEIAAAINARVLGDAGQWDATKAANAAGVCTNSKEIKPGDLFVAIAGKRFDGHSFVADALKAGGVGAIVRCDAPGMSDLANQYPGRLLGVMDTILALEELAHHYRQKLACDCREPGCHEHAGRGTVVIAITGSNGKTTTKRMLQHILSQKLTGTASPKSFNNNIGVPLTLLGVREGDQYVICEVGTNAPGEIAELSSVAQPDIAVITSVGETHLEKLGSIDLVAVEKASMLAHLQEGGTAVVWADSPPLATALKPYEDLDIIRFGQASLAAGADGRPQLRVLDAAKGLHAPDLQLVEFKGQSAACEFTAKYTLDSTVEFRCTLPLPGRHNAMNALAAIGAAMQMGFSPAEAADALASFGGVEMRLQSIQAGSVRIINDAYNANPSSMAAAADVLADQAATRRIMIAGDMRELGDDAAAIHERLGREVAARKIDLLIGVGELGRYIATGAASAGLAAKQFESLDAAAAALPAMLQAGDVVLIKGSRAMAMERLVAPIEKAFG